MSVAGDLRVIQSRWSDTFSRLEEKKGGIRRMPIVRYILIVAISIGVIGITAFVGHDQVARTFPLLAKSTDEAVRDGAKVTVQLHITPQDNPTTTYKETEEFIQGRHTIPLELEQRMAGMHQGESITFPLSAEEGFGPYDETKIQMVPTEDLPVEAREGDTVSDDLGRIARIIRILPEEAILDLNHPLAGKPLTVTLQIVTIESPVEVVLDYTRPSRSS
jgi:peptidylprolyl isomerase